MSLDPQQYATEWLNSVFKPDVENKVELVSGLNTETDTAVAGSLQTVAGQMDTAAGTGGAQDGGAQDGGAQDGGAQDGGAQDGGAQDGGAQSGETQGDETETGDSGGTSDMGKAGEWRPGDIANVLDSVSKITGSIPDLITAIGTLDDDVDDIVKAGGEAIKSGAEGIATVLDSINKMDDQTVSSAAAPESSTDGGTKAGETQGDGAQAAQAGDTQAGGTQAGGAQAGETQAGGAQPGGSQIGETTVGGIHSVGNVVSSGSPAATVPASASQPLYSSLAGFPPIRAFSDSEQEHRRAPGLTTPPTTMPNDEQESPQ
ncbi:hypothetical protein AB0L62_03580 [Nocardia asteroides]|uniref:hypothetical protein n=1 Tax=Nocardia asteroides TaxID=1824 RepID=UPI0034149895